MKKISLVLLILIIVLSASVYAKSYSDIPDSLSSYEEAISYLSEKKVLSGYPDGTFKPEKAVTRAEVIKIIVTSFDVEFKDGINKSFAFDDVKGKWFEDYVKIGASNEIIKGYEDGTFRPDNNVTYGELCAMVCRLLQMDVNEEGDWARAYLNAASEAGLLRNIATNDVIPINKATRMNVAMIIYNALNMNKEESKSSEETNNPVEKPEENKEPVSEPTKEDSKTVELKDLSTKETYYAVVTLEKQIRGIDYIDVETFDGLKLTLEVKNINKKPIYGSLIIFKVSSKGKVSLIKEMKSDVINSDDDMLVVENAEGSLAVLRDEDEKLDISLERYTLDGTELRLDRFDFYMVEVSENSKGDYVFDDCCAIKQEDITLRKEDRILFDKANQLGFIIRGIEEE